MNKIRLDVESLDVQSFVTSRVDGARGTVRGAQVVDEPATVSQPPYCYIETGRCLGTRYDDICDTSYCVSRRCPIDTADCPLVLDTDTCTVPPNC
jgi:hypothetical protein